MMLVEETQVPIAALPVAEFKDHLRLGSGFADDGVQDAVLEAYLRAAMATIEARVSKALIARSFRWSLNAWRDLAAQTLPMAPVSALNGLSIIDRLEVEEVVATTKFTLERDLHRPRLVSTGYALPVIPVGGRAVIRFEAGFGPAWGDVPADLAQAVMMLAALYYENRGTEPGAAEMPAGVTTLIAGYRPVRLFGGGAL